MSMKTFLASLPLERLLALALAIAVPVGGLALLGWQAPAAGGERAVEIPPPALDEAAPAAGREKAVFAGGCFWGVQGVFQHVRGVTDAVAGYAGGARADARYEIVGGGRSGHAESVEVSYDPHEISYGRLLQIYFSVAHDPTQRDRQGPDVGTQYRSAIFPRDEQQRSIAQAYVAQLDAAKVYAAPIATTIEPGKAFFPAEAYHQNFLARNPSYPYIAINDLPKIENLKRLFPERWRDDAVLTAVAAR
ncbi:MAG TPA: peptide-methionine (S)-S-oxide reductase MsrA [Dokdonella sp.]